MWSLQITWSLWLFFWQPLDHFGVHNTVTIDHAHFCCHHSTDGRHNCLFFYLRNIYPPYTYMHVTNTLLCLSEMTEWILIFNILLNLTPSSLSDNKVTGISYTVGFSCPIVLWAEVLKNHFSCNWVMVCCWHELIQTLSMTSSFLGDKHYGKGRSHLLWSCSLKGPIKITSYSGERSHFAMLF